MTGGMTFRGGLPSLPDRAILSARLTFCDVNVWGNVPNHGQPWLTAFGGGLVSFEVRGQYVESHGTKMVLQE